MQALFIGSPELKNNVELLLKGQPKEVLINIHWAYELEAAFNSLESVDVDAVVIDTRIPVPSNNPDLDLKKLLANLSVTTRVLAIVEQLPDDAIFAESGVVYLTPPVNLDDINWFIRMLSSTA